MYGLNHVRKHLCHEKLQINHTGRQKPRNRLMVDTNQIEHSRQRWKTMKMSETFYVKHPICDRNKSRSDEFIPCSMFWLNKIYLYCGNWIRIIQNVAKSYHQKLENVPHMIDLNSTRLHETNNTRRGFYKVTTTN